MSTKVLAIGTVKPLSPAQKQEFMPSEVPATLQLYLDGKMEQFWFREDGKGVVFLMATTVAEADALLKSLPLSQANLMTFDLIPVGPLSPFRILIGSKTPTTK